MPRIAEPRVTELIGFDDDGLYVGSAQWSFGGWQVVVRRNPIASDVDRNQAEQLLRMYGATTIRGTKGVKH